MRHLRNRRSTDNSHHGQFLWTLFVAVAVAVFAFQQLVIQKPEAASLQADNEVRTGRAPASVSPVLVDDGLR